MTLAVSYALAVDRPSARVCGYVLVICMGTAIAAQGDIALPPRGLALQLGANLAEALRVVLSQWLIAKQRLPLLEAQYHVAPSQAGCLLLASLALALLSGCGLAPMYAGGGSGMVAQSLAAIEVAPIEGRAGWLVRSALEDDAVL